MPKLRPYLVFPFVLAACAGADPSLRPAARDPATVTSNVNLSGYPPEFRRGFGEGCAAARAAAGAQRPKGDGPFAVGWSDGFDYCTSRK